MNEENVLYDRRQIILELLKTFEQADPHTSVKCADLLFSSLSANGTLQAMYYNSSRDLGIGKIEKECRNLFISLNIKILCKELRYINNKLEEIKNERECREFAEIESLVISQLLMWM